MMLTESRVKALKTAAAKAILHPLLSHDARVAIAEAAALLSELLERVETLERENDGEKTDRSR